MAGKRIVRLRSANGEIFAVDEAVALQSHFVRNAMEDVGVDNPIPLPNVSSHILGQVLDHCKRCVEKKRTSNNWDLNGSAVHAQLGRVDVHNLHDLIMAANYMHVETLLHSIYHTVATMIAKKTFEEIREIFNVNTSDLARGEGPSIGMESQILASFMESLPTELQLNMKVKVAQGFHHGEWSPWQYDVETQTLFVELANLYDPHNMHQQIAIIHLHVDLGLVNTLVLHTCGVMSLSRHPSGGVHMEWVAQADMDLCKDLMDGIDMRKIEDVIFDED